MFYFWTLPTRSNSKIVADNDGNFILTPGENDGALNVVLKKGDTPLFGGNLAVSGGSIGFNLATQSLSFTKGTKTAFTLGNYTFEFTATDDISSKIAMDANGSFVLTPGENDGSLNVVLKKGDTPLFGGNLTVSDGSIGFNPATQALSFTKGTKTALTLGNYTFEFTATDDISSKFAVDADGNFILTPGENDGSLNVVLKKGDTPIFNNNVSVIGEINFSLATQSIGLADGTKISTKLGDYEVTATADGDAAVTFAMTSAGLSITPVKGDGTLNLKLGSESGSLSANLEVLSGSFILGENGALTVTKDTELQIDFGGGYIVKFKTTDDAGGKISLGAGGLTFTPNIDDGHLELTITKGDETRSATLDVTGTVTYNLDGSISLAQGTVVKNHFNSGANLTITAKTDSDGSIIFNPSSGLTITNNLPGALKATLEHDTIFVFDDIIGSITYNSGKVTVHDGTTAVSWFEASDYQSAKGTCSSTGGDTMIDFASPMQVYSVAEGATYKVEEAEEFWELSRGNLCGTFYEGETVYLLTEGSVVNANESIKFLLESAGNYTLNGMKVTTTTNNAKVVLTDYDTIIVDGISYTPLDENVTLTIGENGATVAGGKVTMQMEGFDIALSEDVTDGSISYNSTTNKFTVKAGTKSYLGEGKFPDQFVAKNDFDISVTKTDDGKFKFSLGDESIAFDLTRNGKAIMGSTITLDGSIIVDPTNNEISLPKDTVITMTPDMGKILQITALDDAGGELTLANGGLRFKPNENDGALEFNFIDAERKATLDVTGAFTYKGLGALSLEDGTVANLTWTDGTELKITSSGSTGSIGIDPDKGIKITSDDENLDMTLTTPYMSTDISGIKGTIYYKEGNVSFDENSKIIATTTLGGQPILTTLETIDGTGHISFSGTTNGIVYSADTGAMKITWSNDDDLESTFVVNKGSIQIGHNLFRIAEGSDIATDLKTFVPALYFTTAEAGTYTINGQKITTSAEGLALTATDDQMVFKTSGDVVEYDGMTFAGNGNVSLKADNVVLGEGVEATGFGEDKSFVLAEAGNVIADAKVFELSKIEGTPREIPMIITVTGAQDGFTFNRTLTKESEAYLDDALDDEKFGNYSSSYIGKVFTEKFIAAGDSSYRIRTDAIGLEEVIGISDGATITGGASLADEPTLSYYNLVTDTTGKFTIGERTYNVSGDSSIALRARFEEDAAPYASMVDSLDGTISGDFSGGQFSINGSSSLKVINDTDVSIVADENGYEILGLDAGSSLQVSAADTYTVNGTEIAAGASSVIVGTADGKAQLYNLPATLADFMLHKTEKGYPQMAVLAFHPDEKDPDPPTNYHSAEKWTTASKDDLQLSAIHYSPENPTGKWVILVHGYGKKGAAMNAFAEPYLAQGLDVLIVDQRTAGDSEGDWLTMGVAEANDLAIWTQEIAKTNANAQITLHGVSMGAATVMLCAALPETTNLSAMIEDCGYGNIADVFATLLTYYGRSLGVGDVDYYELFDEVAAVAKIFDGGYDVTDAAPIESIAAVTVPSLFIHGAADVVIPSTNADALYEASGASNKTKLIIEGAGHAQSIVIDTEAYLAAVKKLIDSSTTEIGALIDSDSDSKVLRGTVYNDTITNSGHSVTIEALDGDDFITNNVDSSVTAAEFGNLIDLGDGNDTVYNHHSYNPTLLGGAGNDSIVISRGHKTFADGGTGNDTIIGVSNVGGWGMGDYATILGGEGNDYINPIYSGNASIDGGNGDDTIFANGANATVDGGTGKNLIVLTDNEGGVNGKFVVLNGNTTVESFNTGFGEGTDTIYIDGDPAGVEFKDGVLAFGNSTDSLTMSDITTTAKVNIYHKRREVLNKGVFIAAGDWYKVEESDLTVNAGEEVYFVGTSADPKAGVDFSGITQDLNITIDTAYIDSEDYVPGTTTWVNGVYSLKGGAGNTTITGSDKDDTILAGTGATTINASAGDDFISLGSASALVEYNSGDGNDTIYGFRADSTLNIAGAAYTSTKSGSDLIFTVDKEKITLQGAASLSNVNIIGKTLTDEIIKDVTGNYDYGTPITDQSEVETLLDKGDLNGDKALLLENKSADFRKFDGSKNVTLKGGKTQDISFNKDGYNVAVVDADAVGKKNISLGGGGDLAVIEDTGAKVSITASKGEDSIFSQGENVLVDLKGGKTDLFVTGGKMTLEGYDASTGTGFGTDYDDVLEAFKNGEFDFEKGKLTIDSAVVDFGKDSELINIFDANGNLQKVGFVSDDDSLNTANEKADLILVGEKGSTITGGKGDDSIYADDGAIVDGGAGKNYIYLNDVDTESTTIALSGGKNTVDNFNATFDDGDKVSVDATTADLKFDGTDLNIKSDGKAVLQNISSEDGAARILTVANGKEIKTAIAQKGSIIAVNDDNAADIYIGNKSGVDFTNSEESLVVDLTDGKSFRGINQITVGGGLNTLIGSSANETLTGNSEGVTEFVFDKGNGRDVIKNFNFDEDKINVGTNAITNVLLTKEGNVRMQIGDGEDWITLEDAQGKSFQINGFTAKVDSNIEYDDEANYFVASSRNATVMVSDEAEIWLDGSHGKTFIGDIKTLDATNSDGKNILAGNNLDNTILAGKGDASLWGGNGGDDLLIGGEGQNMFFYTLGNGNDSISGTNSGDIVYLSAVTLENLAGSEFNGNSVAINFKDGGKLTVNDAENCSFIMGDQTYYVDSEHSDFVMEK